jgi:hypothetical protein
MSNPKKQIRGRPKEPGRLRMPPSLVTAGEGRWSSKRRGSVILELLRGADLESLAGSALPPPLTECA